jgi:hypothetical protein
MSNERAARRPATPMLQQIAEHRSLVQRARGLRWEWKFLGALIALGGLAIAAGIGFLVIDGRLDGRWYDIRDLGLATGELRAWMQDEGFHPAIPYCSQRSSAQRASCRSLAAGC